MTFFLVYCKSITVFVILKNARAFYKNMIKNTVLFLKLFILQSNFKCGSLKNSFFFVNVNCKSLKF